MLPVQGMNRLGYDAMAVGNHEFDMSPAVLAKQRSSSHPGYVDSGLTDADVLRAYIARRSPLKVADYEPGDHPALTQGEPSCCAC